MTDTIKAGAGESTTGHRAEAADEDPATPRGLFITVVVLGVLLILGFITVFGTIAYRVMDDKGSAVSASARPGFGTSEVLIDPRARVRSVTLADGRLAIHVTGDGQDDIILIDAKHGYELGRVRVRANTDLAAQRR